MDIREHWGSELSPASRRHSLLRRDSPVDNVRSDSLSGCRGNSVKNDSTRLFGDLSMHMPDCPLTRPALVVDSNAVNP